MEYKIKGQTLEQIYNGYFNDVIDEQPKITERLNHFEKNMHFEYIDGFLNFINSLKEKGVKIAEVDTKPFVESTSVVYEKLGYTELRKQVNAILGKK